WGLTFPTVCWVTFDCHCANTSRFAANRAEISPGDPAHVSTAFTDRGAAAFASATVERPSHDPISTTRPGTPVTLRTSRARAVHDESENHCSWKTPGSTSRGRNHDAGARPSQIQRGHDSSTSTGIIFSSHTW